MQNLSIYSAIKHKALKDFGICSKEGFLYTIAGLIAVISSFWFLRFYLFTFFDMIWVQPIMSHVYNHGFWVFTSAFLVMALVYGVKCYTLYKNRNNINYDGTDYNYRRLLWCVIVLFLYLIFRFSGKWTYETFSTDCLVLSLTYNFAFCDVFVIFLCVAEMTLTVMHIHNLYLQKECLKKFILKEDNSLVNESQINPQIEDSKNNYLNLFSNRLMKYIDSPVTCGAFVVNGAWGSGKTFLIKKWLRVCEFFSGNSKQPIYVSVFGYDEIQQIVATINKELHPILYSKPLLVISKFLHSLYTGGSFDLFEFLSARLRGFDSSHILIFDDVERSKIDLKTFFGYVDRFISEYGCKVILVMNEAKLNGNDGTETSEDAQILNYVYRTYCEKIISERFKVQQNIPLIYRSFIEEIKADNCNYLNDFNDFNDINDLMQDIIKRSANYKITNLRALKRALVDYNAFVKKLNITTDNTEKYLKELKILLTNFIIVHQLLLNEDINKEKDFTKRIEIIKKEIAPNELFEYKAKYVNEIACYIYSGNVIKVLIENNINYSLPEEIEKLQDVTVLEQKDFEDAYNLVLGKIKDCEYSIKDFVVAINAFRILDLKLYKKDWIDKSSITNYDVLSSSFKKLIEKQIKSGTSDEALHIREKLAAIHNNNYDDDTWNKLDIVLQKGRNFINDKYQNGSKELCTFLENMSDEKVDAFVNENHERDYPMINVAEQILLGLNINNFLNSYWNLKNESKSQMNNQMHIIFYNLDIDKNSENEVKDKYEELKKVIDEKIKVEQTGVPQGEQQEKHIKGYDLIGLYNLKKLKEEIEFIAKNTIV